MADMLSLQAKAREPLKAKALRREGWVPGVMYGRGSEAISLQFESLPLEQAVLRAGTNRLLMIAMDDVDEPQMALFRDVQRDPVTNTVLHVDLYSVVAGETITSTVPVVTVGEAPVVLEGGVVAQLVSELEIECLPKDLPSAIQVDISVLVEMDSVIELEDLDIPGGVTILNPPESAVARVLLPREEEEEEVEELEPALYGEEAPAEGEEAPDEEEADEEESES